MGKIIEIVAQKPRVVWFIDICENRDHYGVQYREAGASRINPEPHWSVCVEAPTVDRLCIMLKKAEEELRKNAAAMRTRKRPKGGKVV